MRQRTRVAAALVHNPRVLLLDEPFNGMDPRQRMHMMELLHSLGDQGHTILFSSHILEEVEQVSGTVQVIVAGRLAASGDYREIRRLMTNRPHVFAVQSSDDRRLAVALIGREVGQRRGDRRGRPDRTRRPTTAASPARCRGSPSARASGCASCCRPTSPWRASSPTCWRHDVHGRLHHRPRAVRPPPGAAAAAVADAADRPGADLPGVRRRPGRVGHAGAGRPRPGRGAAGDRADRRHRRARLRRSTTARSCTS